MTSPKGSSSKMQGNHYWQKMHEAHYSLIGRHRKAPKYTSIKTSLSQN